MISGMSAYPVRACPTSPPHSRPQAQGSVVRCCDRAERRLGSQCTGAQLRVSFTGATCRLPARLRGCASPSRQGRSGLEPAVQHDGQGRRCRRADPRPRVLVPSVPAACPTRTGRLCPAHTPCNARRRAMDVRGDARSPVPEAGGPGAGTRRAADSSTTRRSAKPIGHEAGWDGEPTQFGVPAATSRQTSNRLSTRASVRREHSVPQASSVGPAKVGRHEHIGPMHRSGHLSNGCVDKTRSDNGS
jgi:hypothetical protein